MRLVRLGPIGAERSHLLLDDDRVLDVTDQVGDFNAVFFGRGGLDELHQLAVDGAVEAVPMPETRLGAPVARPGKIVCIGLNYADHAAESGAPIPTEPVVFFKASNTLVGPNDDVHLPRGSTKTDWEVELAIVIGRTCRYLESEDEALASVAGYMVCHDVSEREFQLEIDPASRTARVQPDVVLDDLRRAAPIGPPIVGVSLPGNAGSGAPSPTASVPWSYCGPPRARRPR